MYIYIYIYIVYISVLALLSLLSIKFGEMNWAFPRNEMEVKFKLNGGHPVV